MTKSTSATKESIRRKRNTTGRARLETEKLSLEIADLKRGYFSRLLPQLTVITTVALAVGGWIVQTKISSAASIVAEQNHRDQMYIDLEKAFESTNPPSRASAAVALGQFAQPGSQTAPFVIEALVSRLSEDDDVEVQAQIIETLSSIGELALPKVIDANKKALVDLRKIAAEYLELQVLQGKTYDDAILGFVNFLRIMSIPEEWDFQPDVISKSFLASVLTNRVRVATGASRRNPLQDAKNNISDEFKNANLAVLGEESAKRVSSANKPFRYLVGTSLVIRHYLLLSSGKLNGKNLDGITLMWANLTKKDLRGISLRSSNLNVNADRADFGHADLSGAVVDAYLGRTSMRYVTMRGTIFTNDPADWLSESDFPDLTGADWWDSKVVSDDSGQVLEPKTPIWWGDPPGLFGCVGATRIIEIWRETYK
jgi:uncharacterized protein YjbI with pentapeptide repeats